MSSDLPPIDIQHEHWTIVRDVLKKHMPQHTVWAFGSRVTGNAKPYSDLDLAMISDKPMALTELANLREAFSESDLPWKVDIVDWATTSASFREIIEQNYVTLQAAAKDPKAQ